MTSPPRRSQTNQLDFISKMSSRVNSHRAAGGLQQTAPTSSSSASSSSSSSSADPIVATLCGASPYRRQDFLLSAAASLSNNRLRLNLIPLRCSEPLPSRSEQERSRHDYSLPLALTATL